MDPALSYLAGLAVGIPVAYLVLWLVTRRKR